MGTACNEIPVRARWLSIRVGLESIETCGRCTRTASVKGLGMDERRQVILGAGVESEWVDKPFGGHGDVYRWLRANYAFVVNWIAKQKPSWETIAAKMAREGIIGAKGKQPAGHSVRRVWKRVLKDVATERERELAEEVERAAYERELLTGVPAKKYPRDLPRTWPPPLADGHGSAERQPSRTLLVKEENSSAPGDGDKEAWSENSFDLLLRTLNERSSRPPDADEKSS